MSRRSLRDNERKWAAAFILPTLIGQIVFTILPIAASFLLSFCSWDLRSNFQFIGWANFRYLFSDPLFFKVIKNTLYFTVVYVPIKIILALVVAQLINEKIKGIVMFRSIFFIPALTSMVAISVVWMWLYNYDFGLINILLSYMGITGPNWLGDPHWAMPSVLIMSIWQGMGYAMVIILAALQNIDKSLLEAAAIDGASIWKSFIFVKLPLLTPTIFLLVVTNIFYGLQIFTEPFVLTKQGPVDATNVLTTYMYDYAFRYQNIGVGSAVALALFIIMTIITIFQFKFDNWVKYND